MRRSVRISRPANAGKARSPIRASGASPGTTQHNIRARRAHVTEEQSIPRYLGIDYGTKRIGLAVSDAGGGIASPLMVLDRARNIDAQVRGVIESGADYDVERYVLGIPFNMDGSEGEQAKLTRRFGLRLATLSHLVVHEWDERLSSRGADEFLSQANLTYKKRKARRDAVAAQIILQSFLDAQAK